MCLQKDVIQSKHSKYESPDGNEITLIVIESYSFAVSGQISMHFSGHA
jgi:hypothetical protein